MKGEIPTIMKVNIFRPPNRPQPAQESPEVAALKARIRVLEENDRAMIEMLAEETRISTEQREQLVELTNHINQILVLPSILKARQAHNDWQRAKYEFLQEQVNKKLNDISETPTLTDH